MSEGIFRMCLGLMAVVSINQLLGPSEKNGIVPEDREEILQRMKEHEVTLQLQKLRLEKEIADLEGPREAPAQPASHLERKIQRHTCKEHEVTLQLQELRLEKEIADPEGPREAPAQPASHLERKIQQHTCAVFVWVAPALLMLCWRHWEGATAEDAGEGDTDRGLLGKVWKGVALLTKPFVLLRAISISMARAVGYLGLVASRLVRFPLKLLRSTNKDFVH